MKIKQISISKLFGIFNHVIPLNINERMTIIIGPNGFGKTALLTIINGLFNRKFSSLRKIPFNEFKIEFNDGTLLMVKKQIARKKLFEESDFPKITFIRKKGESHDQFTPEELVTADLPIQRLIAFIEHEIPELDRVGQRRWVDSRSGEVFSFEDVIDKYKELLPLRRISTKEEPEWLIKILDSVPVRFIETQRLLSIPVSLKRPTKFTSSVAEYSKELSEIIQSKLAESAMLSQSLDRTFPTRLVKHEVPSSLMESELRKKLEELELKRSRLIESGLLDRGQEMDFHFPKKIDDTTMYVLSVYIRDVEQKLSVFDDISAKIELLKNIINNHFLYKRMEISKEKGFVFINSLNEFLSPTDLSSGEQHELVLLFELLFKVKPNSLILIDEPELSLHVAWQEEVLRDLENITKLANLDVILATHSPQIIHDKWDLTVELKEPKK